MPTARRATIPAMCALVAGCVLPVTYTQPASPNVIGWYRHSDGTPATGARVVVTNDGDDRACRRPLGVATTDTSGVFRLQPTMIERRGVWLVPAFEHFTNDYWVCISAADSVLHMAYKGVTHLRGAPAPASTVDSLACLEWTVLDSPRVTCVGPNERRSIQIAGRWTDGNTAGHYRLIVVEPGWDARDAGVFLQWVEGTPVWGTPGIVRETWAAPFARKIRDLEQAELMPEIGGRPACVTIHAVIEEASFWTWNTPRERAAYVLGPPGQVRRVANCADGV